VLGRLKGRGKGSGAPVDQPFAGIFDFRGERIWRYRAYFDHAEGLRAAGLSEWAAAHACGTCQPWAKRLVVLNWPQLQISR